MKKFTQIFFALILLFSINIFVNAQTNWTQIKTENEELKFSIPSNFTFFLDEEVKIIPKFTNGRYFKESYRLKNFRSIGAYENGVAMWLESYDVKDGKDTFPYFIANKSNDSSNISDYKNGEYSLRSIVIEKEHYLLNLYFHSDKKLYILGVGARDKNNPVIQKLLQSLEFNGKNLFTSDVKKTVDTESVLLLEQLETTPLEVTIAEKSNSSKNVEENDSPEQINDKSNQKPLIILSQSHAGYTDLARRNNIQGKILLNISFGRDGQIKKINVVKSLKYGLVEKTIEAARRFRFLPQETDGKPQDVTKVIQYNFSIY